MNLSFKTVHTSLDPYTSWIGILFMITGLAVTLAVIIIAKNRNLKPQKIAALKRWVTGAQILVFVGLPLYAVYGTPESIPGFENVNIAVLAAGILLFLNCRRAFSEIEKASDCVRKKLSAEGEMRYFPEKVYAEIATADSVETREQLQQYYNVDDIALRNFLHAEYESFKCDVAEKCSIIILLLFTLPPTVFNRSLLGAALCISELFCCINVAKEVEREQFFYEKFLEEKE